MLFRIACTWLAVLTVLVTTGFAQPDVSGTYEINANGHIGDLFIQQSGGTITGKILGDNITQGTVSQTGAVRFVRSGCEQKYKGTLGKNAAGAQTLSGTFDDAYKWTAVLKQGGSSAPATVPKEFSGQWFIYSGGRIGATDEYKEFYRGTLTFRAGSGGVTGVFAINKGNENLCDIVFTKGKLKFTRPGIPQYYEGTLGSGDKITGIFDHKGIKQRWWASRTAAAPTSPTTTTTSSTTTTTSLTGEWSVVANGHRGTLVLTQKGNVLTGTILGDPIAGGTVDANGNVRFTRTGCGQKYTGKAGAAGGKQKLTGTFDNAYNWEAVKK